MVQQDQAHVSLTVLIVAQTLPGTKDAYASGMAWDGKITRHVRLIEARDSVDPFPSAHVIGRDVGLSDAPVLHQTANSSVAQTGIYQIGEVWEVVGQTPLRLCPPHREDFWVYQKRKLRTRNDVVSIIERQTSILHGHPNALYEGFVKIWESGALYIDEAGGIPAVSAMFWRTDRPLQREMAGKRIRYRYPTEQGGFTFAYVGMQEPVEILPAGTLLYTSLARWWRPAHANHEPQRCFVQLSGWFGEQTTPLSLAQPESLSAVTSVQTERSFAIPPSLPQELLKSVFGYSQFRPLQKKIIDNILAGQDTLVIMPTGSGKSLCYQIPALCFPGLTVVVSPLISLMQDQVMQLQKAGVAAAYLNSTLNTRDYAATQQRVRSGEIKLLYVAPETLLRHETLRLLESCDVSSLAIDEAHCISHWGHDFRPDYRQIATVRRRFPQAVCVALTATATDRVREDIKLILHFRENQTFLASFDRSNLYLAAQAKLDLLGQTLEFLGQHRNESGIIYCNTQRQVDSLYASLCRHNISALPYHGGLDDTTRRNNQTAFLRDDVLVMVATVAFGMGINKPDIRFVLHADLPKNLEFYYQEIGRAGRDGLPAQCLLLWNYGDISTLQHFIQHSAVSEQDGHQKRLQSILSWADSGECRRKHLLAYFDETYHADQCSSCDNCNRDHSDHIDITAVASCFLACVQETREIFGPHHIIKILRGSQSKDLTQHNHHLVQSYGTGKSYSAEQWNHLVQQLIQQNLLQRDLQYGSLKLTDQGRAVLRKEIQVYGTAPATKYSISKSTNFGQETPRFDAELFQKLRTLRKSIADQDGVPPFVVFSDRALQDMATYFPHTPASLEQMYAIGRVKVERYADAFLPIIRQYCQEHGLTEKNKEHSSASSSLATNSPSSPSLASSASRGSTPQRTLDIANQFCAGNSLDTLANLHAVKRQTIVSHLARYVDEGNILPENQLLSESTLPSQLRDDVLRCFATLGDTALRPIFETMQQKVPYDEIHLLRVVYRSQKISR